MQLASYMNLTAVLPTIPTKVGHANLLPADIGMLANDSLGDCVIAGAYHETEYWLTTAKRPVPKITDAQAIKTYSTVTGYIPGHPETDQGTDMSVMASFRRKTGIKDAAGGVHKIGAYLALQPGNINELRAAIYLFGIVGVGVNFPSFWMDNFDAGLGWSYRAGAAFEGGHYIPAYASASKTGTITIGTWGRPWRMSAAAYKHYNDESYVYLSEEFINGAGKTIDGFNLVQLQNDLSAVGKLV